MARRPSRRRFVARAFALGVIAAALTLGLLSAGAGADIPGYGGPPPGSGQWIAFALSPQNPSLGQTVTLSLVPGSAVTPLNANQIWGPTGDWPSSWSDGGVTLQATSTCPVVQHPTSCDYTLSGSPGTHDNVFFGMLGSNVPPDQVQNLQQHITVPPPPTSTTPPTQPPPPPPSALFSGPPNNQLTPADHFTFSSPNVPGVTYTWTLRFNNSQIDQQSGPTYTPPASIFQTPGQYTLTLRAEDQNTHRFSESPPAQFLIEPPSAPSSPAPQHASPASPPVAGPPAPAQSVTQVSFTPRLPAFATPKPGAVQPVTVIWLWRPDWFQSAADQVKTRGRPSGVRRAAVSVNANRGGPSATPWLAGLATFGIFGAAWLAVRRRQVRTSILD